MEIKRSGSQPSGKGPAKYFTGIVRIDPLFEAHHPARALGASVTPLWNSSTTARPPIGWKRSATSNTAGDLTPFF